MLVEVVTYDPNWPNEFELEASNLKQVLPDVLVEIYHIGSTAVPALMAKPIIDIMLAVSDLEQLDLHNTQMTNLGYEAMGELGIPGRRYFRKGGNMRTHQVHAFLTGDPNLVRHLAFRDYLIEYPDIAAEYGALKFVIAENCNNDIERYCDEKDPFVKLHEKKALAWYSRR